MTRPIVIVGASLAGLRAAQAIRKTDHDGPVVVVGDEPHLPYTRPPLSKELLAGAHEAEQCALPNREIDVEWRLGTTATGLDPARRELELGGGERLAYDRLLIATGARARTWPAPLPAGVVVLRGLDDALALRAAFDGKPEARRRRRRLRRLRGRRHGALPRARRDADRHRAAADDRRSAPRSASAAPRCTGSAASTSGSGPASPASRAGSA